MSAQEEAVNDEPQIMTSITISAPSTIARKKEINNQYTSYQRH
jgi:hypothetical protein